MSRLDKRPCLYGRPRLSDAQVRALRDLALDPTRLDRHRTPTLMALKHMGLIWPAAGESPAWPLTEAGRKLLREIEEHAS